MNSNDLIVSTFLIGIIHFYALAKLASTKLIFLFSDLVDYQELRETMT